MKDVTVVYFGGADWSFRREPQHYLLAEVLRRGGQAYYVENTGVRWPRPHDIPRVWLRLRRALMSASSGASLEPSGVRVISPLAVPIHSSDAVRLVNRLAVGVQLRRAVPTLRRARLVSWISLPNWTTLDVTRSLAPETVVYYAGEEYAAVPHADPSIRKSEREVLRRADLVFATSRRLQLLCERAGRSAILAPVAVDVDAFAGAAAGQLERPHELRDLPGKIIGYLGGMNHKVEISLMTAVVDAFPNDSIVVLGSVEDPGAKLAVRPNLHVLGERAYQDVPPFLQHFDVCLIPYKLSAFNDSVSPAKLIDYLAAGRPVVSTPMAEVLPFRDVVRLAKTPAEFVAQVRAALNDPDSAENRDARVGAAAARSYAALVPPMIDLVQHHLDGRARDFRL